MPTFVNETRNAEHKLVDKYFATLDLASLHMQHAMDSPKAQRLFRHVLDLEHDAGPEADYIIRTWKKERGLDESHDRDRRGDV